MSPFQIVLRQVRSVSKPKKSPLQRMIILAAVISFGLTTAQNVLANPVTLDFESFNDGTSLTNQLLGLSFSSSVVLTAGQSLNEAEYPPKSGVNVISDDGGPLTIDLLNPSLSFSGYFTYAVQITLAAYDSTNTFLGSVTSSFNNNSFLSGDVGSTPNEFLTLSFAQGISRIVITGDPLGGSFALDDVTIETPSAVPEPASLTLLALGCALYAARNRKKISKSRG